MLPWTPGSCLDSFVSIIFVREPVARLYSHFRTMLVYGFLDETDLVLGDALSENGFKRFQMGAPLISFVIVPGFQLDDQTQQPRPAIHAFKSFLLGFGGFQYFQNVF